MSYNSRSPAVKRLMKEAQELAQPTELYAAHPLEDNLFEWHFTIRGPEDTPFHGGIYHGRILLPSEYPMKPPNILLLTPNGRFEVKRKICLSISGYHPESWRPCWSIRTALLAIIGFMPTHGGGAIGSLEFPAEERKKLSKESLDFVCPDCGPTRNILLPQTEASIKDQEEAKTLASQIDFQGEKAKGATSSASSSPEPPPPSAASPPPPPPPPPPLAAFTGPLQGAEAAPALAWSSYYPYYYAAMLQSMQGGGLAAPVAPVPLATAPLSFEQWLVQVKGYKDPVPTPEAATPSTGAAAEPPGPESQLRHRKPAEEEKKEAEKEAEQAEQQQEAAAAEEEEEKEAEVEEKEAEAEPRAPVEAMEEVLATPPDPGEEWPLFSVFVICLLLLLVLLANRFLLPPILGLFSGQQ